MQRRKWKSNPKKEYVFATPPVAVRPMATAITTTYGRHCFKIKSRNGFKQTFCGGCLVLALACFSASSSCSPFTLLSGHVLLAASCFGQGLDSPLA